MARRRLTPALRSAEAGADVPRAEHPAPAPALAHRPIARVAAEAAGAAALRRARRHRCAAPATAGRMVLDLPLDAIAPDHLARDRLPVEDDETAGPARLAPRPRPAHPDRGHAALSGRRPALRPDLRLAPARRR